MDPSARRDPELEGSAESALPQPVPAAPRPRLLAHPSASEPVRRFERVQTLPHQPAARPTSPEYSWAPARVASNRPDGSMDCHELRWQRTYSQREIPPSRRMRSKERGSSPGRSPSREADRADWKATSDGLQIRSVPGPQPSRSDPWDLARGQRGAGVRRQEDADETDSLMLAKEADGEELAEGDPMDEEEDHSPGDMRKAGERRRGEKREERGEATGLNRSTDEVCGSGARRRGSAEADGATDGMGGGGAKCQRNRAEADRAPEEVRGSQARRQGNRADADRAPEEVRGSQARRQGNRADADRAPEEVRGSQARRQGNRADADRTPEEVRGSEAMRSRSKAAEPWSRERGEEEKRRAAPAGVYRSPEPGQGRTGRRRMAMGEGRSLEWSEEEEDEDHEGKRVQHSPARRRRPAEKAQGRGSIRSPPSASREQAGARREKAEEHLWAERRAAKETSKEARRWPERESRERRGEGERYQGGEEAGRKRERGKRDQERRGWEECGDYEERDRWDSPERGREWRREEDWRGKREGVRTPEVSRAAEKERQREDRGRRYQERSPARGEKCWEDAERRWEEREDARGRSTSPMGPRRPGQEEEGQEPEYTCLALRSHEELGLRSGGRDGRKGRALRERTEGQVGLYVRKEEEEEEEEEKEQEPEYAGAVLRSSAVMGLRSGGRDGGREQATKVRAWAVAGEEEKDEKVREWAVAEGEEKDEKEKAGGCEFVAADTEGKNEKVREWALAEREEKDEKEEAGVCELVAAGTEGMNEKVKEWAATEGEGKNEREGTWACVPAAAEAEEKDEQVGAGGEKGGAVKKGGKKELSSTDMGGSGWQPALRTAELFGEIRAGAKTGVTMKDRMQAEEQAQGNKLAEQHVRKLREGRPELLGEAEQESEEVGAGEPLATGEKADHAMEEAENRAAWEQAKAAEHLEEVIPVSVEDLHTVQLRDACSREQWQQQEGKGIRAAREASAHPERDPPCNALRGDLRRRGGGGRLGVAGIRVAASSPPPPVHIRLVPGDGGAGGKAEGEAGMATSRILPSIALRTRSWRW
ncbi:unnamed protein product [Closterium sp. NIES-64]|nr:unnamed protein product [Closterium sp. NIES-64]